MATRFYSLLSIDGEKKNCHKDREHMKSRRKLEMIGVSGHDSAQEGHTGPGTTWAKSTEELVSVVLLIKLCMIEHGYIHHK